MDVDIADIKYQTNYNDDKSAGDALGEFLDEKYEWLKFKISKTIW